MKHQWGGGNRCIRCGIRKRTKRLSARYVHDDKKRYYTEYTNQVGIVVGSKRPSCIGVSYKGTNHKA